MSLSGDDFQSSFSLKRERERKMINVEKMGGKCIRMNEFEAIIPNEKNKMTDILSKMTFLTFFE